MYEVFTNNKRLVFNSMQSIALYDSTWKIIKSAYQTIHPELIAEELFSTLSPPGIVILSDHPLQLWERFIKRFKKISAAGGLVTNKKLQLLFIFRNNKWDLPKGKAEENEKITLTALREVEEETGLGNLKITSTLPVTYHLYKINNKPVIKETHWFEMICESEENPVPQEEEGITLVKWLSREDIEIAFENTYVLIEMLVRQYLNSK